MTWSCVAARKPSVSANRSALVSHLFDASMSTCCWLRSCECRPCKAFWNHCLLTFIIIIIIIMLPVSALRCLVRIYVLHWQPFNLPAKMHNFIYQCINSLPHLIFHFRAVTHHIIATYNIRYVLELITKKNLCILCFRTYFKICIFQT